MRTTYFTYFQELNTILILIELKSTIMIAIKKKKKPILNKQEIKINRSCNLTCLLSWNYFSNENDALDLVFLDWIVVFMFSECWSKYQNGKKNTFDRTFEDMTLINKEKNIPNIAIWYFNLFFKMLKNTS